MKTYKKRLVLNYKGKVALISIVLLIILVSLITIVIKEDKDTKKRVESTCTSNQVLSSYYSNDGEKHYYCK